MKKSVVKKLRQTTLDFVTSSTSQTRKRKMAKTGDNFDEINVQQDEKIEKRIKMCEAAEKRKETQSPFFTNTPRDSDKGDTEPANEPSRSEPGHSTTDTSEATGTQQYSMSPDSNDFEELSQEFSQEATKNWNPVVQIPNTKPVRKPEGHWKGVEMSVLHTAPACLNKLSPLKASDKHTVMFTLPYQYDVNHTIHPPKPHPYDYTDKWDADHVHMPCSVENKYPVQKEGKTLLQLRWNVIKEALQSKITGPYELEDAILTYNQRYRDKWNFSALNYFFTKHIKEEDRQEFFGTTLKAMANLALKLPSLCTRPIPLLKKSKNKSISFSQEQIACLLANAFFCTFPRRNTKSRNAAYSSYPEINFNSLFQGFRDEKKMNKLQCVIHYFKRVTTQMPLGVITFTRQTVFGLKWEDLDINLSRLHVTSNGTIEDDGRGMLQVDFANKFIGGGVLRQGCVQEEIRFLICPEMIVTCLFTEFLEKHDSLIMLGCEQFSTYEGYADSFKWAGNHYDTTCRDINGRLCTEVVAIDALVINEYGKQFQNFHVVRELNKAYSGFCNKNQEVNLPAVCTGNWGCGAFGGDKKLKALIQLMAAAAAKRDVCYFTFEDDALVDELYKMHYYLTEENPLSIGHIIRLISEYYLKLCRNVYGKPRLNLFEFIYETFDGNMEDTDDSQGSHENSIQWDSPTGDKSESDTPGLNRNDSVDYKANTP